MRWRKVTLKHLKNLTDDFGIWQHTIGKKIDKKHGYALDDSARALIVANKYGEKELAKIYKNYLERTFSHSFIANFYTAKRIEREIPGSYDAIGESYWAVSYLAPTLLTDKIKKHLSCESLRGKAYALIGAVNLGDADAAEPLVEDIVRQYLCNRSHNWEWPENELTYANAIIPYSILPFAEKYNPEYLKPGLLMLDFLNKKTKISKIPIAIGNSGWLKKGKKPALFDQQPIDPAYQVLANVKAYEITRSYKYLKEAKEYFYWFWGKNMIGKPLIDYDDSCADAACLYGIQKNRGAESIICYLLAQDAIWKYLDT